eukprot:CAMPEP_0119156808 /NCGR_PEP_ID=MMETSP1310-20130426/52442_1 /TAXON_ID=464262 /ORGANISM="Genus nov. species nov., Strain RCC2339" /LENGTH=305 /DNA_ID=CAMNT_0007149423 /DNA_START=24 /DNA_END=942 /DNA_ORIENTATION=+
MTDAMSRMSVFSERSGVNAAIIGFCTLLFCAFFSQIVTALSRPLHSFQALDQTSKLQWSGRVVSFIVDIIILQAGVRALLWEGPELYKSAFTYFQGHTLLTPYFVILSAYELWDTIVLLRIIRGSWKRTPNARVKTGDVIMLIHHLTIGLGSLWVYYTHLGLYCVIFAIFMESISPYVHIRWFLLKTGNGGTPAYLCDLYGEQSPYVHIRWFLLKTGNGGTPAYFLNGVCLALTFFVFRLVSPIGYLLYVLAEHEHIPLSATPSRLTWYCTVFSFFATVANLYWFGTIVYVAAKDLRAVLRKKQS